MRTFEINCWENLQPKFRGNAEVSEVVDGVKLRQKPAFRVVDRLKGHAFGAGRKCDVGLGEGLKSGVIFMRNPKKVDLRVSPRLPP